MAFSSNRKQLANWGYRYGIHIDDAATEQEIAYRQLEYWIQSTREVIEKGKHLRGDFLLVNHGEFCTQPSLRSPWLAALDRKNCLTTMSWPSLAYTAVAPVPLPAASKTPGSFWVKWRHPTGTTPKGNRENRKIISLHKDLLKSNGGSWDDPPKTVLWKKKHQKTRDRIIREFSQHPVWGFKDPRALLALDGCLEALPNLKCVGIFRNPFLGAQSLQRRNEFPLEKALALWLSYNRQLVHHHDRLDFPIVSFDEEANRYIEKVRELTTALDIGLDAGRIAFFSPELRHVDIETDDELPEACAALYADLQARAM